jgi:hypothetical protein
MNPNVLERAREKVGGSTIQLEQIYRLRAARQMRRRVAAGITAIIIVIAVSSVFARALEGARRKHPETSPTISQSWIDETPSDVKARIYGADCALIGADPTTLPRAIGQAKDPFRLGPSTCHSSPTTDLHAVASGDVGFVVVGDFSGNVPTNSVWYSPDGRAWSRVPQEDGLGQSVPVDVIAGGPGFLAVGIETSRTPAGMSPAAWYSSDGRTWARADMSLPSDLHRQVDAVWGLIPTDTGFIAWGRVRGNDGYVWTSTDGRSWHAVPDESVFGGDGDQGIVWLGRGGDGFVAGGYERPYRDNEHPVAWTSVDGITWTRMPDLTASQLDELRASVSIADHTMATSPRGTVQIGPHTIQFQPTP